MVTGQQVRFENESRGAEKTVLADVHVSGTRNTETARGIGRASSTLNNPTQDQELTREFRGLSDVKGAQLVSGVQGQKLPSGRGIADEI
jgi:hypothetical protein